MDVKANIAEPVKPDSTPKTARESAEGGSPDTPAGASARGKRKTRVGVVVSSKMDKTVVVAVERVAMHPLYHKRIKRTSKFKAHDENNSCREGDRVKIVETRPLSKEKRWRVVEIIERVK
ncbi:MAG TPA: 30S ribosomal protein S17 [Clostridia bacterium]|nr:30S ribosomal protein S17 [Clostridia bacterium]